MNPINLFIRFFLAFLRRSSPCCLCLLFISPRPILGTMRNPLPRFAPICRFVFYVPRFAATYAVRPDRDILRYMLGCMTPKTCVRSLRRRNLRYPLASHYCIPAGISHSQHREGKEGNGVLLSLSGPGRGRDNYA